MSKTSKQPQTLLPETREVLLKLISRSEEPLTAKQCAASLSGPFKATEKQIAAVLEELVAAGMLTAFSALKGKALRYWNRGIDEYAQRVLLTAMTTKGAMKFADLKKTVLKSAKGLSDVQFQNVFDGLVAARRVLEHPPVSSRTRTVSYGITAPSPEPYLGTLLQELKKVVAKLAVAGVPRDKLAQAGLQMLIAAGIDVTDRHVPGRNNAETASVDLVRLMRQVEPGAEMGALVTLPELRRASGIEKPVFDQSVLQLARSGAVTLHRHDFPANLSEAERETLVTDGHGIFYIGVSLRQSEAGNSC